MKIKELCKEERPRERLLAEGARALSNAQLLAVLLGSGTRKVNVLEVANRLLADAGGDLQTLAGTGSRQLRNTEGIGPVRYAVLSAAFELGKRCWTGNGAAQVRRINGPADIYRLMAPVLQGIDHEECWAVLLNRRNRPVAREKVSEGGTGETSFPLERILKNAVERNASALALVHNHPSGDPHPSRADIDRTAALHDAVRSIGVLLLDHVIVADGRYYSFSEDRVMPGIF